MFSLFIDPDGTVHIGMAWIVMATIVCVWRAICAQNVPDKIGEDSK